MLAKEDAEVHLHAFQTMTEQFQLCEWGIVVLENCIIVWKCLDHGMHVITQPISVLHCSKSAMKGNNGTNRILYHDIAAQTITEPPLCFTVGTRQSGL
jgi:hypothetical protein